MYKFLIFLFSLIFLMNVNQTKMNEMKESTSKFDTEKLTEFAILEITKFANEHKEEIFYGFSIDAQLLCLNSEEQFQKTLERYRNKYGGYDTEEEITDLKHNTGDWEYQGFAKFDDANGFNHDEYSEHYHLEDENQLTSDYAKSMDKVVQNLINSGVFDLLKKTDNFYANRVEHNY